jgi:hypothetical protein
MSDAEIAAFCEKWGITRLDVFGSVLRDDFSPASDIDVLVDFLPGRTPPWGNLLDIQDDLALRLGRSVDVNARRDAESSRNYIRRREILGSAQLAYQR